MNLFLQTLFFSLLLHVCATGVVLDSADTKDVNSLELLKNVQLSDEENLGSKDTNLTSTELSDEIIDGHRRPPRGSASSLYILGFTNIMLLSMLRC